MWNWLKGVSPSELYDLQLFLEELKSKGKKPFLKGCGLDKGPLTYLRINVCSVSVTNSTIESDYDPAHTKKLIKGLNCPAIFTYGSNAKEVFPEFDWQLVKTIKVPNMRRGGTADRHEYVCYINF